MSMKNLEQVSCRTIKEIFKRLTRTEQFNLFFSALVEKYEFEVICQTLLDAGYDINYAEAKAMYPEKTRINILDYATYEKVLTIEQAQWMLKKGAKILIEDFSETPRIFSNALATAIRRENYELCVLYLKNSEANEINNVQTLVSAFLFSPDDLFWEIFKKAKPLKGDINYIVSELNSEELEYHLKVNFEPQALKKRFDFLESLKDI